MAVKLRTRLFLVVAVLLGASIAVSALLSRRATLVEVRAVVSRTTVTPDGTPALDRAAAAVEQSAAGDLGVALAAIERDTSRRIVVADADRRDRRHLRPVAGLGPCHRAHPRRHRS